MLRRKEIELDRERGVPGCYLALGTARWGADSSGEPAAPVFLRRCRLRPTDAGARDYDVELAGQFQANPALVTYLRAVHAVDLDFDALLRLSHRGHGFDPTDAYAIIDAAAAGIDGWRIRKSGEQIYIHLSTTPLLDSDGHHSGFIDYSIDITKRKQVEDALAERDTQLRQQHMLYQALLEAQSGAGVGLFILEDGKISFANAAVTLLTGFSNEELL